MGMIARFGGVLLVLVSGLGLASGQAVPVQFAVPYAQPVNPNATSEARELLKKIDEISGHYTLTGQHNFPNHQSRWSDRVYDLTGKFPAIFGQDFGFAGGDDKDSVEGRPSMIEEAKRQYQNGAVVALTWHAVRPTDDEPVTFKDSVQGHLTDFEWKELLTPGTGLYNRWAQQVDVIAGYLRQLQAAGVPVLFRPYHEMNGDWFWWGGRPGEHGSAALYRQLYDRFVHVHHLNNLIWVWNVNSPSENAGSITSYYPGSQYADVATMDIYGEFKQSYYVDMVALAGAKPIALAEVGAMPTLDILAKQPRWAYFMMWSGLAESSNSPEQLQAMFHAPNLLNRGDAPFEAPRDPSLRDVEPVTQDATPAAREILLRLREAGRKGVLSDQQNLQSYPEGATQAVFDATHKHPSIYGAELDVTNGAEGAKSVIDAAIRQNRANSIVSLRWLPPNPAAMNIGALKDASPNAQNGLTDFEWRELMTAGTHLNANWCAQVDDAARFLKMLNDKGIAVLWAPYPESNSKQFWWAGCPGVYGSAALYRMLFDRLVNRDHLHNLLWMWEAAPAGFGAGQNGAYAQYFPGYLYVDTLQSDVNRMQSRFRSDEFFSGFAIGKIVGLRIEDMVPEPTLFERETKWAWFTLAPALASGDSKTGSQSLQTLYDDPRVVSR